MLNYCSAGFNQIKNMFSWNPKHHYTPLQLYNHEEFNVRVIGEYLDACLYCRDNRFYMPWINATKG